MATGTITNYLDREDPTYAAIKAGWSNNKANIDFNTLTSQGVYYCAPNVNHAPDGRIDGYWRVIVLVFGGAPQQFALKNGSTVLYTRYCSNGSWGAWAKVSSAGAREYTKINSSNIVLSSGSTSASISVSGYNSLEWNFYIEGGFRQTVNTPSGSVVIPVIDNTGYAGALNVTLSNGSITIKNNTTKTIYINELNGIKIL